MTTAPSTHPHRATSNLVLPRNVGEGLSLGEQRRFDALDLSARFVTFAVTDRSHSTSWQLEVDDALQIGANDSLTVRRRSHPQPARLEIRATRVTTQRVTVVIHGPRALEIARQDRDLTYRTAT